MKTTGDIAKDLGVLPSKVQYIAKRLRDAGDIKGMAAANIWLYNKREQGLIKKEIGK